MCCEQTDKLSKLIPHVAYSAVKKKKFMKVFFVFILLTFRLHSFAQQTYVPDDNFEQALINLGYDIEPLDDYVPTANIIGVEILDISV